MYSKIEFAFIISIFGLSSCTSSLYSPTQDDAIENNISLDSLQKGRKLYVNKCSSCHNLHLSTSYTNIEWLQIMVNMQKRSIINNDQKELITKYLNSNSKEIK